jgi:thioredoxin reductase
MTETSVTALEGQDGVLKAIRYRSRRSGEEISRAIRHLFLFIGANPNTTWLSGSGVSLDDKGFVRTGANVLRPLETSLPGVFAIGDVRSGSTNVSPLRSVMATDSPLEEDGFEPSVPYYSGSVSLRSGAALTNALERDARVSSGSDQFLPC